MQHVHFVGAGGAGGSSVIQVALARGYIVSGCDSNPASKHAEFLRGLGVNIFKGHNVAHLEGVDIVAASPAAISSTQPHPEIELANRLGKLMTWQTFLGSVLMKDANIIAVAGTHGKTTTTALMGLTLEAGGLDPTVIVGGEVQEWKTNARIGHSKYYVCEADEYNNNFKHYCPRIIVLNNVEFEHPEYFANRADYFRVFVNFVTSMPDESVLVANLDDAGVSEILFESSDCLKRHQIRIIGVSLRKASSTLTGEVLSGNIRLQDDKGILFDVSGVLEAKNVRLGVFGRHNVSNVLGVIAVANSLKINIETMRLSFERFGGVNRRLQVIYQDKSVRVYDDYGHHPTEIGATLHAIREHFPKQKIIAIIEPHMVSRFKLFPAEYVNALSVASRVYFTKVFFGREAGKEAPNLHVIVDAIGKDRAELHSEFDDTVHAVIDYGVEDSTVIVFGAGNSPTLTKGLVSAIKERKAQEVRTRI